MEGRLIFSRVLSRGLHCLLRVSGPLLLEACCQCHEHRISSFLRSILKLMLAAARDRIRDPFCSFHRHSPLV